MIHENNKLSYSEGKADGTFKTKREACYAAYRSSKEPLTDREVSQMIGERERNGASPRINEMLEDGLAREVDSVICPDTGKRVRRCVVVQEFFPRPSGGSDKSYSKANKHLAMVKGMLPKEAGFYWYGREPGDTPKVVEVVEVWGSTLMVPRMRLTVPEMTGFWSTRLNDPEYGMTEDPTQGDTPTE